MFQTILILLGIIIVLIYLNTPIETFTSKAQLSQLVGISPDRICNIHYDKNKHLNFNIIDSPVRSLNEVKNDLDKMTNLKYIVTHKNKENTYTKITTKYTNP
jgi:hypothetical protein